MKRHLTKLNDLLASSEATNGCGCFCGCMVSPDGVPNTDQVDGREAPDGAVFVVRCDICEVLASDFVACAILALLLGYSLERECVTGFALPWDFDEGGYFGHEEELELSPGFAGEYWIIPLEALT